ncbi:MAG: carboxypeptidase-like regulatory domain-containing protein [Rhodanobacter sp.]
MNSNNSLQADLSPRGAMFSIRSKAMVIALGICGAVASTAAFAQATAGSLYGWAPAGQSITVQSKEGFHRQVTANAKGHYSINVVPSGVYSVTLEKDGLPVVTHQNVNVIVGRGQEVDFVCRGSKCPEASNN